MRTSTWCWRTTKVTRSQSQSQKPSPVARYQTSMRTSGWKIQELALRAEQPSRLQQPSLVPQSALPLHRPRTEVPRVNCNGRQRQRLAITCASKAKPLWQGAENLTQLSHCRQWIRFATHEVPRCISQPLRTGGIISTSSSRPRPRVSIPMGRKRGQGEDSRQDPKRCAQLSVYVPPDQEPHDNHDGCQSPQNSSQLAHRAISHEHGAQP
jgi:hypothetical protein